MTWLVIGFIFLWFRWHHWPVKFRRVGAGIYLFFIYIISTPFLPRTLNSFLEDQYPPFVVSSVDTSMMYNIVVLGGGMGYDERLPPNSLLEPVMLTRLVEGVRVHKALSKSRLITSGYSSIGRKPQGEVAREAAISIGVSESSVFAQGKPSNTQEEAFEYVAAWGKDDPVIIATSAVHMPRAVFLFKKAGVTKVIAAPTHYRIKRDNPFHWTRYLKPNFLYWGDIASCLHEIVGMWHARWTLKAES